PVALQQRAVGEDPRAAAAPFAPLPRVLAEARAPVQLLEAAAEPVLQVQQVRLHRLRVGLSGYVVRRFRVHALRSLPSRRAARFRQTGLGTCIFFPLTMPRS